MKQKVQARKSELIVNVFFIKKQELADESFSPHFCVTPRDRYPVPLHMLKDMITGADWESNESKTFFARIELETRNAQSNGYKQLVILMVCENGMIDLFVSD